MLWQRSETSKGIEAGRGWNGGGGEEGRRDTTKKWANKMKSTTLTHRINSMCALITINLSTLTFYLFRHRTARTVSLLSVKKCSRQPFNRKDGGGEGTFTINWKWIYVVHVSRIMDLIDCTSSRSALENSICAHMRSAWVYDNRGHTNTQWTGTISRNWTM